MNETIMTGLEIMGYGMAGIFVAVGIIMIFVWGLQWIDKAGKKEETE